MSALNWLGIEIDAREMEEVIAVGMRIPRVEGITLRVRNPNNPCSEDPVLEWKYGMIRYKSPTRPTFSKVERLQIVLSEQKVNDHQKFQGNEILTDDKKPFDFTFYPFSAILPIVQASRKLMITGFKEEPGERAFNLPSPEDGDQFNLKLEGDLANFSSTSAFSSPNTGEELTTFSAPLSNMPGQSILLPHYATGLACRDTWQNVGDGDG